ncbi:uncharacterized protein N7458_000867 [Penicillium daleae]|uniref:Uncharacterized protein n=1 Tax=Penicillium daleae TaxID=63821 RepID=A0AAD6CGZ1_9EURO|nr:uncharacterized protein N7458_000867 [Penicillium daleae]KAJ5465181.1 hypothetical protein N7458_000867 [Penicillium daleae]
MVRKNDPGTLLRNSDNKIPSKSALRRLGASLYTSDLAEHQSKLEFYATSIRDEVAFLIAQRIEGQAESESYPRSDTLVKSESRAIPVVASIESYSPRLLPVDYITENDEPDYDEPDYDEPDYDEPDYDESDNGEPDNGEPDNGEPDNGESDHDEARQAMELVMNYFRHHPSGMAPQEYITFGKLRERIELTKLAGRERKV